MSLRKITEEGQNYSGTHIWFAYCGIPEGKKTRVWEVINSNNESFLGNIRWYNHWRKYCFYPEPACVFEEVCMREISQFIVERTKDQKNISMS